MNRMNEETLFIPEFGRNVMIKELHDNAYEENAEYDNIEISEDQLKMIEFKNFRSVVRDIWKNYRSDFDSYIEMTIDRMYNYARYDTDDEDYFIKWLLEIKNDLEEHRGEYSLYLWSKLVRLFNNLIELELQTKNINQQVEKYNDEILRNKLSPYDYYWNSIISEYHNVKSDITYLDFLIHAMERSKDLNSEFIENVSYVTSILIHAFKKAFDDMRNLKSELYKVPQNFKISDILFEELELVTFQNHIVKVCYKSAIIDFSLRELRDIMEDYHEFIKLNHVSDEYFEKLSLVKQRKNRNQINSISHSLNQPKISINIQGEAHIKQNIYSTLLRHVESDELLRELLLNDSLINEKIVFKGTKVSLAEFFARLKKINIINIDDTKLAKWITTNFKTVEGDFKYTTTHDVLRGKTIVKNNLIGTDFFPLTKS